VRPVDLASPAAKASVAKLPEEVFSRAREEERLTKSKSEL